MTPGNDAHDQETPKPIRRVRVLISGTVQGVCFRAYTEAEANARGLSGWVRNLPDRRVEAVFQGAEDTVDDMLSWCWKGSPYSRVTAVDVVEEQPLPEERRGFRTRY